MHLYSNNLSAQATNSSLKKSEIYPACISCSNNLNLSQSSFGSDDKRTVFVFENDFFLRVEKTPEAMIAGELSELISVRSRVDLLPGYLTSKFNFLCKILYYFLSDKLA